VGAAANVFRTVFYGGRAGGLVCTFADVGGYGISGTEYFITIRRRRLLPDDISGTIVSAAQQVGFSQLPARLAAGRILSSVAITRAVARAAVTRGGCGTGRGIVAGAGDEVFTQNRVGEHHRQRFANGGRCSARCWV